MKRWKVCRRDSRRYRFAQWISSLIFHRNELFRHRMSERKNGKIYSVFFSFFVLVYFIWFIYWFNNNSVLFTLCFLFYFSFFISLEKLYSIILWSFFVAYEDDFDDYSEDKVEIEFFFLNIIFFFAHRKFEKCDYDRLIKKSGKKGKRKKDPPKRNGMARQKIWEKEERNDLYEFAFIGIEKRQLSVKTVCNKNKIWSFGFLFSDLGTNAVWVKCVHFVSYEMNLSEMKIILWIPICFFFSSSIFHK